jgi:hypothetical protein
MQTLRQVASQCVNVDAAKVLRGPESTHVHHAQAGQHACTMYTCAMKCFSAFVINEAASAAFPHSVHAHLQQLRLPPTVAVCVIEGAKDTRGLPCTHPGT